MAGQERKQRHSDRQVRASYDSVAYNYTQSFIDELQAKPLDRALLAVFAELVGNGTVADIGCGPGHVTNALVDLGVNAIGIDLSPSMLAEAQQHFSALDLTAGSVLDLPFAESTLSGAVALYSIIHLAPELRPLAYLELARVVRHEGWLLLAFHIDGGGFSAGDANHLVEWFGQPVDLDAYFLDIDDVSAGLAAAGFEVRAQLVRSPNPTGEVPTRRGYLLAHLESGPAAAETARSRPDPT